MIDHKAAANHLFRKDNLSTLVEEYIKNKILRGEYKGGDRLLEIDLSEELGISRGPVREGIKAVEQTGIITVEPRKGAYVTKFDKDSIQEVFEIRLLLENSIFEELIAGQKLTDADFEALRAMVDQMVSAARSKADPEEVLLALNQKDAAFHQYIWRKSSNRRKEKVLNDYFFQLRLAMLYDTKLTSNLMRTATDHFAIIHCLRSGDIKNCKQALIDHIVTY